MKSLFGYDVPAPVYPVPLTARDRAARLREKIESKNLPPFNPADFDLSSFPRPETQSMFIGQNLYIKPSYVVSMPEYCFFNRNTGEVIERNPRTMTEAFIENQKNLAENETNADLSRKAVTGIRNSINWLCVSARKKRVFVRKTNSSFYFRVNFVTLTLPDTETEVTPADLQKKLLNPFLTYFRKYHGLKNYVWRIERQKNGKLHVHLTCDTFLHHRKVRDEWNSLLDRHGYLSVFFKEFRHKDPNSTDVHATRKVKNLVAYLSKYMSKKPEKKPDGPAAGDQVEKEKFKGRVWGCSRALSRANKARVHIPSPDCAAELRCFMNPEIPYKELTAPEPKNTNVRNPYTFPGLGGERKKFGEVYFLKASDWITKIKGMARDVFDTTRWLISRADERVPVFELT